MKQEEMLDRCALVGYLLRTRRSGSRRFSRRSERRMWRRRSALSDVLIRDYNGAVTTRNYASTSRIYDLSTYDDTFNEFDS